MSRIIAIVGHGGIQNKIMERLTKEGICINTENDDDKEIFLTRSSDGNSNLENLNQMLTNKFDEFDEQKQYWDVLNKINNVRYTKPVFHKCKSCGFLVVDYQLDKNGVCVDCRKVDGLK